MCRSTASDSDFPRGLGPLCADKTFHGAYKHCTFRIAAINLHVTGDCCRSLRFVETPAHNAQPM